MTFDQFKTILKNIGTIPTWDNLSTFDVNITVWGSDGKLYQALSQNTGKDPLTNPAIWVQVPENFGG